jgi:hypothetical protein
MGDPIDHSYRPYLLKLTGWQSIIIRVIFATLRGQVFNQGG